MSAASTAPGPGVHGHRPELSAADIDGIRAEKENAPLVEGMLRTFLWCVLLHACAQDAAATGHGHRIVFFFMGGAYNVLEF